MSDIGGLTFVNPEAAATYWNILLYGPAKNGKTVAAASAPGPILYVNAQGPAALRFARKRYGGKLREVAFEGKQTLDLVVRHLREGKGGEQTVVLDTLGDVHQAVLRALGGNKPQIQHYGAANTAVYEFVKAVRDLPVNVVLIAHEQVDDSEEAGATRRPLTGGQKLPEQVMGEMDIIAYCGVHQPDDKKPPRYMGQLVQARGRRCGDRSGALGAARELDLSEWISTATEAMREDTSDAVIDEAKAKLGAKEAAA